MARRGSAQRVFLVAYRHASPYSLLRPMNFNKLPKLSLASWLMIIALACCAVSLWIGARDMH